jgi:hypothetical protein
MRLRKWSALFGSIGLALALPLALAAPAGAEVTGPCRGTIKGVDVATRSSAKPSDAILVGKKETIDVGATAATPIARYKIQLAFAGINWTVAKGKGNGNSWSKTVNVSTYARYGVGLYRVSGVSSGGANCTGAALVKVEGSPFGSVAGIAGAALSVIGIGAVAANGIRGFICGPKPVPLGPVLSDPSTPLVRAIVDIKTPRDYVDRVVAICTGYPSRYSSLVSEVCGPSREVVAQICRWG